MRSGWMSWVRTAAAGLALAAGVWAQGAAAAEVKNVTAQYAWPWGVEIRYDVVGTFPTNDPLVVTATDRTKNVSYTSVSSTLSGDTGRNAGAHRIVWDLDKQGIKIQSTNVVFTVEYRGAWCVVDLSAGANASSYPVTYLNDPPSGGFNKNEYKTTKLVLRRIEPGSFKMGGKYQTTLSKAYYIGVFEVTQKQYQQVMGSHPSYENGSDFKEYLAKKIGSASDAWPVGNVSWIAIRGNSGWPASPEVTTDSFMGRLRTKTGLEFDLPTEAQWEYACRAGTTSTYNNGGNTTNDLNKIARWSENNQVVYYSRFHCPWTVGSYQPNAWGLYDMHGNVWEWCLDWYGTGLSGGTNPKGPSTGSRRILRGGGYGDKGYSASVYTSSYRESDNPSAGNYFYNSTRECFGFRIARMPQADEDR